MWLRGATCATDANARLVFIEVYRGSPLCLAFFLIQSAASRRQVSPADPGFAKHTGGELTRNYWATKSATACAVQKQVLNPSRLGPRCRECTMRRNSAPLILGLRLAGPAFSSHPGHNAPLARPSDTAAADFPDMGTIWRPASTASSTHRNPGLRHEVCPCHPIYLNRCLASSVPRDLTASAKQICHLKKAHKL